MPVKSEHKTILVTGSNGQLGSELKTLAPLHPQFSFIFLDRSNGPINDKAAMAALFEKYRPSFLVNCAAYTAVDKAEKEIDFAFEINGRAVGYLAEICTHYRTAFIHISTDYVFDGNSRTPLRESAPVQPVNQYGASKLFGEELALHYNPEVVIIRTSWVYSFYGNNFVKTMIRLMKDKGQISVVSDQTGSPTYAADLASLILQIITHKNWAPGIYNFSNDGATTWYDFAIEIKNLISSSCKVLPISTEQYPTPAKRPAYSVLDKSKVQQTFGTVLIPWQKSLHVCIGKLNSFS